MLYTGYISNAGIFNAFVFHICLYRQCPSETIQYTPRDENRKNNHTVSELQYKYRFMHTMKASFPIFWLVSQHCYNALLCKWAVIFFPHMNVKGRKNKRCLVCSELTTAACCSFILNWICFFNRSQL